MEGTGFEEDGGVVAVAPVLRRVLGRLHQAGSPELGPLFAALDELKSLAGAGQVGALDQALTRRRRPRVGCGVDDRVGPRVGAVLPGWWRGFVGAGGRGGRQAVQRPTGRGGPVRAGPGRQRRGGAGGDGQAAAAADPGWAGTGTP